MKEKILENSLVQAAKIVKKFFKEALPILEQEGKEAWQGMKKDLEDDWARFKEELKAMSKSPENLVFKEEEFLNKEKLVAVARQYIVSGSNEVYAWKKEYTNYYVIYLTYGVSGEPIETSRNYFVNIKAEALAKDVLALFGNSELIVLK